MPTTGKKKRAKNSIPFQMLQKMHNHQSESNKKLQVVFPQQIKKVNPRQIKNPLHLESQVQDMKNFTLQGNCNPFSFSVFLIDQSQSF